MDRFTYTFSVAASVENAVSSVGNSVDGVVAVESASRAGGGVESSSGSGSQDVQKGGPQVLMKLAHALVWGPPAALLLDQLIPGVRYVPEVPRAVGSEHWGVRAQWVSSGKWVPTGVTCPVHARWLLGGWAGQLVGLNLEPAAGEVDARSTALRPIPSFQQAEIDEAAGAALARAGWLLGEGVTREKLLPWQWSALGLAELGYWRAFALYWPPGGAKTFGALLWLAARPRPCVVLTPSEVKTHWARQVRRFAPGADPFVWTAPSLRRKKDRTLNQWLSECAEKRKLPILIVGHETLVDAWDSGDIRRLLTVDHQDMPHLSWRTKDGFMSCTDLVTATPRRYEPGVAVVADEIHLFRNPKRWKGILNPDGSFRFQRRTTKGGEKSQAVALMELGRWASARCGTTGTQIANRVDQWWVQLDFLDTAGSWGTYYEFSSRYSGGRKNEHGGWESKKLEPGETPPNAAELRARLQWLAYEVPYSVTHGALPPKRRETLYLPPSEQVQEIGSWSKLLKEAAAGGPNAIIEMQLMRAASRKRKYVVRRVVESVKAGQKVVVLTGRRRDADALGEAMSKALGLERGDGLWWAHGGNSQEERSSFVDAYMAWSAERDGRGCVLVGTVDCFGIGIDLQDTDLMVIAMLPRTWDVLWQAENRVSRVGQKRPVLVEYVIAEGTVDESVAGAFLSKLGPIGALTASEEVGAVGESLAGLSDPEALLSSIWEKIVGSESVTAGQSVENSLDSSATALAPPSSLKGQPA